MVSLHILVKLNYLLAHDPWYCALANSGNRSDRLLALSFPIQLGSQQGCSFQHHERFKSRLDRAKWQDVVSTNGALYQQ